MRLDIRLPIGLMFSLFGLMLLGYGAITHGAAIYQRSLGYNLNLLWGAVLFAFGGAMLWLVRRATRRPNA
jgi:hypothetical protein